MPLWRRLARARRAHFSALGAISPRPRAPVGERAMTNAATDGIPSSPSSLYKYVDIPGLKRILAGSIRFTQPSAFNDPFELLPEVVVPNDATERQLSFSFDVLAQRRHPPPGALDAVPDGCQASDANVTRHRSAVQRPDWHSLPVAGQ